MTSCALSSPLLTPLSEKTPNQCGSCFTMPGPAWSTFLVISEMCLVFFFVQDELSKGTLVYILCQQMLAWDGQRSALKRRW